MFLKQNHSKILRMTNTNIKTCCTCKIAKDISFFGNSNQSKDGLKPNCRPCNSEYARQRRKNPEIEKSINEKRSISHAKRMLNQDYAKSIRDKVNKRREDPEIRRKHNEYMRELNSKKYHTPEQTKIRQAYLDLKSKDPEHRKMMAEKRRVDYQDPKKRAKMIASNKKHYDTKIRGNEEKLAQMNEYSRRLYAENESYRANVLLLSTKWRKENPELKAAQNKYREMLLKNRVPSWANANAIAEFYKNKPKGYHVDHIVPIAGKKVSGLHVESNLQYLPAIENLRKSNSFKVE